MNDGNETERTTQECVGTGVTLEAVHPVPDVRDAHDAEDHEVLKEDPSHEDAKVDIALDESFPTSDAPGHSAPGTNDPAPSSGYDEQAERALANHGDTSKGPLVGQDVTAPKVDPQDGAAVDELIADRQPRMGPKTD